MKVILTQELKGRGGEGDVIEVARGFAVNYLLPRKVAVEATPGNLKQLEQRMHKITEREEKRVGEAESLAAALEGKTVRIGAKVGDEGRLFGSVTAPMVAEAIADQLGVEVDRRRIETHGHIKEVGPHAVDVAIYREVRASLTVEVVPEGAPVETGPALEEILAEVDAEEAAEAAEDAETDAEDAEADAEVAEVEAAESTDAADDVEAD